MPVISVLWGLALLAAVAVSLLWNGNMSYRLARNGLETASINATIEAAVSRGVLALLAPQTDRQWRTDGVAQSFEFGPARMKVTIQDELGRVDMNQAAAPLLISLLQSSGLDAQSAASLADKIMDWRAPAPVGHVNGAKDVDYRVAGGTYRPRNGPFQSVDELLLVMNMTPTLFRRIEPALTVYSGRQFVDPQVAPREVLLALPNMSPNQVDSVLAARSGQQAARQVVDEWASRRGRAFSIRTEFEKSNGTISHETTVRLTDNPAQPYWVLSWKTK